MPFFGIQRNKSPSPQNIEGLQLTHSYFVPPKTTGKKKNTKSSEKTTPAIMVGTNVCQNVVLTITSKGTRPKIVETPQIRSILP